MIGVHFFKGPKVALLLCQLDTGAILRHTWTVQSPVLVMVAHGSCKVGAGPERNALWLKELPTPFTLTGMSEKTVVSLHMLSESLDAEFGLRPGFAGDFHRTQQPIATSDLTFDQALLEAAMAQAELDDDAWRARTFR